MKTLESALSPDSYQPKLVYDLDSLLLDPKHTKSIQKIDTSYTDDKCDSESVPLDFESRFESGNLRRAYRVIKSVYNGIVNFYTFVTCSGGGYLVQRFDPYIS